MDGETGTELPDVVAAFVRAVNEGQHEALLKTFAEDALVNDQLTEHRGVSAISTWASGEVIGQRLVMRVRRAVTHSEQTVVTATVDGSFDKRGLPDPLVVTFSSPSLRPFRRYLALPRSDAKTASMSVSPRQIEWPASHATRPVLSPDLP